MPPLGGQTTSGSVTVRRVSGLPRLLLHVIPVGGRQLDFGLRRVAALVLVLVVDPASRRRIDPGLVSAALGLTASESQVAVMLCEGRTPRDIAAATGRQESTIYVLSRRACRKLGVSRQVDLVRMLLSLADVSPPRR